MAQRIVEAAALTKHDLAIEIGPGTGALTWNLARSAGRVIALEVDQGLVAHLAREARGHPTVEIRHADARTYEYGQLADAVPSPSGRTLVVANLPYATAIAILRHLVESRQLFHSLVLMLQREVAERLVSPPGRKSYGLLSLMVQLHAEVMLLFTVPPEAFAPPPKVESAVVRIVFLPAPRVPVEDEARLFRIIRAAFAQRRKTLSNALRSGGWSAEAIGRALAEAGVDPGRRGESLGLHDFARLAHFLRRDAPGVRATMNQRAP